MEDSLTPEPGSLGHSGRQPNVLLITTDEERAKLPRPDVDTLPGKDRLTGSGTSFDSYRVATGMCSPSRSVIYTGQHTVKTDVTDNDNLPFIDGLPHHMATLGHLRARFSYARFVGHEIVSGHG